MSKRGKIEEKIAADEKEIKRQLEKQRQEREYYNQVDGRPRVDRGSYSECDPLLEAFKQGKR